MKSEKCLYLFLILLLSALFCIGRDTWAQDEEDYTYSLTESTAGFHFWTTPPSERVFKDDAAPVDTASGVKVYAARNEFEPFQIVVKPVSSGSVTVQVENFGTGFVTEIYQVKYVNITQVSDSLGRTGPYPDPLWPLENGAVVDLTAGENTAFWFSVYAPPSAGTGDVIRNVTIGGVTIPVTLHVFDFILPDEVHVKSQMNFSYETILNKYGVSCCGDAYWEYVDKIKQYFIDHRFTPKSVTWPAGLTSQGGGLSSDYQYNCDGGAFVNQEPNPKFRFENLAERYIDGTGLLDGQFAQSFNNGTGFPSFMVATFQNNDASADQRPSTFCGLTRSSDDWYAADNPNSAYNQKWFEYIGALYNHLQGLGYQDKAYFYFANEPQNDDDYAAVAWYSRYLKDAAPDYKLMVSEEPKPEIYNHDDYVAGGRIDIWLAVLNNYDPAVSWSREADYGEETWIYWLYGTRPPYFNPITLDHPGIESKFTGWFLWKYRVRGIAYYSLNNWSQNPWTNPMTDNHNGDRFMLYPPTEDNSAIAYGDNGHRFVPSIRFELMRDSLEDYEYLRVLNGNSDPAVNVVNDADSQADKIITSVTSYTRSGEFMYNLRRLIGLKNGGEIATIPDIQPPVEHPRSEGTPGNYYINFQDPSSSPAQTSSEIDSRTGAVYSYYHYNGNDYFRIGWVDYDANYGYGWYDTSQGDVMYQYRSGAPNELQRSIIYDDWGRLHTFDFDLPNGAYNVTVSVGWEGNVYSHNKITIEGVPFIDDEASNYYLVRTRQVTVNDNKLTLEMGIFDRYTMLNYLEIKALRPLPGIYYLLFLSDQ